MDYFDEGNKLYNIRNYKQAIKKYKKSIEFKVHEERSYYNMGCCYIKLKDYNKAIECLRKAMSFSRESEYYFNLGYCYAYKEDYGSSLFNFIIASKLDENDYDAVKAINVLTEEIKELNCNNN